MIEVRGNLWTYPADVRVITTNGFVKKNGEAVMGRGCALEAKKLLPGIEEALGRKILAYGNKVFYLGSCELEPKIVGLYTFPVKHNWWEKADLNLIKSSAEQLADALDEDTFPDVIVLPRPGCGNGQLKWEDVKPILEPILDNRFHVITF